MVLSSWLLFKSVAPGMNWLWSLVLLAKVKTPDRHLSRGFGLWEQNHSYSRSLSYTDDRGQRRLTNVIKRATKEYEFAHDLAIVTEEPVDQEHADDLRKILLSEVQEARLSLPPPESRSVPTPLEQVIAQASEVLGKLSVLVPVHSLNEPDVHRDSGTAQGFGAGDGPANASNDKQTHDTRTEFVPEHTNADNQDDLSIYEIGPSISRQNSNHSGLSGKSIGSHVELTRSQIARERDIRVAPTYTGTWGLFTRWEKTSWRRGSHNEKKVGPWDG